MHGTKIGDNDAVSAQLAGQLLEYIRVFGSKLCCFSDLKAYVLLVSPAHQEQVGVKTVVSCLHKTGDCVLFLICVTDICFGFPLRR